MTQTDQKEIESLIVQWTHFSEYIEKLDTEHWHVFTVVFAAFGLFSIAGVKEGITIICWVIPLTIMVLFYYEAYRLREIAIMKGFLAHIEKTINVKFNEMKKSKTGDTSDEIEKGKNDDTSTDGKEGVFNWYYSYELVFMTNNNVANQLLPYPILLACVVIWILSVIYGWQTMQSTRWIVHFIILNIVALLFDLIAIFSISNALRTSEAALNENITQKQKDYRERYQEYFEKNQFNDLKHKTPLLIRLQNGIKNRKKKQRHQLE